MTDKSRKAFEAWYCTHVFDIESEPMGGRSFTQQWSAWHAASHWQFEEFVKWVMAQGYASGSAESVDDLLSHLVWQAKEQQARKDHSGEKS
jgi:hypothetical protein